MEMGAKSLYLWTVHLERIQIHCSGYFIVKLGDFHRHMRT